MTHIESHTCKGQLLALPFGQTDLAVSQTDVQLFAALGEAAATNDGYAIPFPFEVVGVSWQLTTAATAGTLSIGATINGTEDADTTLAVPADSATTSGYKRVARGAAVGTAGQVVGAEITTNGSFAPITADLSVLVYVIAYLEGV